MVSAGFLVLMDKEVLQWSVLPQKRNVDTFKREFTFVKTLKCWNSRNTGNGFDLNLSANIGLLFCPLAR